MLMSTSLLMLSLSMLFDEDVDINKFNCTQNERNQSRWCDYVMCKTVDHVWRMCIFMATVKKDKRKTSNV